jgi:HK97 family phage prohead protease
MKLQYQAKAAELQGKRYDVDIAVKAISIDEKNYTATFVMSTASIDRHGDIVDQDTWNLEHFLKNPAFFWGHRSNEFPLGKWLSVTLEVDPENPEQKMLVGVAEFAVGVHEDIDRAWKHVVRGDLNMVSVGFIPKLVDYDEEKDAYVLKYCELMECSLVGIGSNRRALIKDNEDVKDIKDTLIDTKKDIEEVKASTPVEATSKAKAIAMLNKAIRQYKK